MAVDENIISNLNHTQTECSLITRSYERLRFIFNHTSKAIQSLSFWFRTSCYSCVWLLHGHGSNLFLFCYDQAAKTAKQPLSTLSWFTTVAGSFLYSFSCTVIISRYLNAAYTNRSADYLCFTLINMWGHQCKRWLQSPASLVAMKQNHTRLCMCKDSLEAFLSPSL